MPRIQSQSGGALEKTSQPASLLPGVSGGLPTRVDANFQAMWKAEAGKTWGLGPVESQQLTYMMVDKDGVPRDWIVRLTAEGLSIVVRRQPDFEDMYTLIMNNRECATVIVRKGKPAYVGHSHFENVQPSADSYPNPYVAQRILIDSRVVLGTNGKGTWNMYPEQLLQARSKAIAGRLAYPGLIGNIEEELTR